MYRVELSPSALRSLEHDLPPAAAAAVLEALRGTIAESPHRAGGALRGPFDGQRSARRGPYRIVYSVDERERLVYVARISHRRDAYRRP